ncbi:hypothetical protein BMS3Bbin02_01780 [bacterium BMS3Bbin02]|nr:hypothetical protein BMS3Bbin02_01780 [bacterium BMS3Bbin02]
MSALGSFRATHPMLEVNVGYLLVGSLEKARTGPATGGTVLNRAPNQSTDMTHG